MTSTTTHLGDACTQLSNAGAALDAAVKALRAAGMGDLANEIEALGSDVDIAAPKVGDAYLTARRLEDPGYGRNMVHGTTTTPMGERVAWTCEL